MRRSLSALYRPGSFMTCPSGAGVANGGDHFLQHTDRESSMCRCVRERHASTGRSVAAPSWELSDTAQYPAGSPESGCVLSSCADHVLGAGWARVLGTSCARDCCRMRTTSSSALSGQATCAACASREERQHMVILSVSACQYGQRTAARVGVCARGDRQAVPVRCEGQQHQLLLCMCA